MKFLSVILLLCVLFGCNTQKEVEHKKVEFTEISLPTLINDVVNGGLFYEEKHIKIRAVVKEYSLVGMQLETHRSNVFIYVPPNMSNEYKGGESYTFKLYVHNIDYTLFTGRPPNWHIHTLLSE